MNVLVVSDIHDNEVDLKKALKKAAEKNCQAIIFCGDTCSLKTFLQLSENNQPLYAVLGNMDREAENIKKYVNGRGNVFFDESLVTANLAGRKIAINHYPEIALTVAEEKKYDAVFYGHTHEAKIQYSGSTLIANPGEIAGNITGKKTYGVYNTDTNSFEVFFL